MFLDVSSELINVKLVTESVVVFVCS